MPHQLLAHRPSTKLLSPPRELRQKTLVESFSDSVANDLDFNRRYRIISTTLLPPGRLHLCYDYNSITAPNIAALAPALVPAHPVLVEDIVYVLG